MDKEDKKDNEDKYVNNSEAKSNWQRPAADTSADHSQAQNLSSSEELLNKAIAADEKQGRHYSADLHNISSQNEAEDLSDYDILMSNRKRRQQSNWKNVLLILVIVILLVLLFIYIYKKKLDSESTLDNRGDSRVELSGEGSEFSANHDLDSSTTASANSSTETFASVEVKVSMNWVERAARTSVQPDNINDLSESNKTAAGAKD